MSAKTKDFDPEDVRLLHMPEAKPAKPQRTRATGKFIIANVDEAIRAAKATDGYAMLVWLYLVYRTRLDGTRSITLGNIALREWGISRSVKARALGQLAAAGFVTVQKRSSRRSPIVTLLV